MNKENWSSLIRLPSLLNQDIVVALRSFLLSTNTSFFKSLNLRYKNCYSNISGKRSLISMVIIRIYVYNSVHKDNLFILSNLFTISFWTLNLLLNWDKAKSWVWKLFILEHSRKAWEQNYIVTNSFLTQICYLALQKLLNLTVCSPSGKLNIYILLLSSPRVMWSLKFVRQFQGKRSL